MYSTQSQGQAVLMNFVGNSASIGLLLASGLPQKFDQNFQSPVMSALFTGHMFAIADDLWLYVSGGQPNLIGNMNYQAFENTALYNAGLYGAVHFTGLDASVVKVIQDTAGEVLPDWAVTYGTLGGMISVANLARQTLAQKAQSTNPLLGYIVNPLSIVGL